MTITIGDFFNPRPEDQQSPDIESARETARNISRDRGGKVIAVWCDSKLDRVFARGYELKSV